MKFILKVLSGLVGSILANVVMVFWKLIFGEGLRLSPISEIITPVIIATLLGFAAGFLLHRTIGVLLGFVSRFGIEPGP